MREWHVDLGIRLGYTKLASTKQLLDRRLDLPLKLDVLGLFDNPHTVMDSKSEFSLNTLYAGIGREETDWLAWTFYVGGTYGKDHTHQRTLNANLTTEFDYLTLYTGVTFEIYPWGTPDYMHNADWKQRLRSSRPYLLTGGEIGFVSAGGRGDYSLAPLKIYGDSEDIRDWLFSVLLGVGWGIPLSDDWSVNLTFDYAYHLYRPEEYNTWNLITTLRYRL
ncbi:MAG: hypothetical protein ACYTFA_12840 [Planctomycetota bacterium]